MSHLEKIKADKFLKVSEVERKFGLKPAIWFSKNSIWEPTSFKIQPIDVNIEHSKAMEIQAEMVGLVRIGIEFTDKLVSWAKYKYISKIPPQLYSNMEQFGREFHANPKDWYCSFSNVYESEWKAIEQFLNGQWVNIVGVD